MRTKSFLSLGFCLLLPDAKNTAFLFIFRTLSDGLIKHKEVRIAVNTQHLLKDKLEGIGWFAHETLSRIVKAHPEHEFLFIFDRAWDESFIYAKNVTPVKTMVPSRHPFLWWWHYQIDTPKIIRKYKPDVYFSPDGWMPLDLEIPVVDVIHDINFIHRKGDFPFWYRKYYNRFFPKFAKTAKRIITVSEYSKQDISSSMGVEKNKMDVAYNGCNELYMPVTQDLKEEVQQQFSSGLPYFVYVGSQNPRKNIAGMFRAFDQFKENTNSAHKLVVVGKPMWERYKRDGNLAHLKHKDDILFTGRLSSEVLHLVLASAEALVLVSFSEGFGIPVLEAMYCDVPVICSNVASLPEVAGEAAIYVNPSDIESISKAYSEMAKMPLLREKLIKFGREQRTKFSWDKTAEIVWNSILKAVEP